MHIQLQLVLIPIVVCEKPFVPTYREAVDLVNLSKRQNKLLAVYQSPPLALPFPSPPTNY